jgi:DNA-binding GntR family transcriptional regulator
VSKTGGQITTSILKNDMAHACVCCFGSHRFAVRRGADPVAATRADLKFHSVWVWLAANPHLEKSIRECRLKLMRIEIAYFSSLSDMRRSLEEHRRLWRAIERRNLGTALSELKQHWQASVERCLAFRGPNEFILRRK